MRAKSVALACFSALALAGALPVHAGQPTLKRFAARIEATKQAMMGDPMVARKAAEQAVTMARAMANDPAVAPRDAAISLATADWLYGEALIGLNDSAHAAPPIAAALASVARNDPGSKLEGNLLRSRATLAEGRGDVQGALKDYLQAYKIFRQVGQARSQAIALQDIGGLYLEAADYERVRKYYSQSMEAYGKDPQLNLTTYNNRGQSYQLEGRFAEAEPEYRKALASARGLDSALLEARVLTNLAETQAELGKVDEAARTIAAATRLVQSGEGIGWRPYVYGISAKIAAKRGDYAGAARLFGQVFAGKDLARTEMQFRDLHKTAAEVYEKIGDRGLALQHLRAFQRLDSEGTRLIASASAQLMAAQFDFANQNLRISQLKQGQLRRDITIERQRNQFRTNLFVGLGGALLIIFGLLGYGYIRIRRSRDQVRAANDELSETNVELGKALKARTDFLATTSHEIRTPLNGILGMTQVLLADRRLAPDTRERIQLLMGAGETMKTLVDDILDVAKMEAGELSVAHGEVDLSRLIGDSAKLWREAAANKGLTLDCAVDDVPDLVLTDGDRLRQILANLLSNAVKFTPKGGRVSLEVTGRGHGDALTVAFAVRDSGIGIPPDEQARIFEAFTQVNNSTTREYSGTGLGLAISLRLAAALGGTLGVESVEGEGSCFTLALPVERIGNGLASYEPEPSGASLDAARLLLIERNEATHPMLRMLLGAEARSIDIVLSGAAAIARMDEGQFDHVLIEAVSAADDHAAPTEALRAVIEKARSVGAKASLLATPTETLGAAQLFAIGADQLILKPIGAADLIAALKKLYALPAEAEGPSAEQRAAG